LKAGPSINKINKRNIPFEEIYDLFAIRVIVDKIEDCYHTLGLIHALFAPIHERFKDYIAQPKPNGYQSLHTTVIGPSGKRIEIQIRTEQMHRTAEDGIAAHFRYKEGRLREDDLDKHLVWARQVLESEEGDSDSATFMEHLKISLFQDEVFVFTPKGDLHRLPSRSTPVDFAFAVHTSVGLHCLAAKINGRIVPLSHELRSGDTVEIITSANQEPNNDWLRFVVSSRARARIKKYLRDKEDRNSITLGEEMLTRALQKFSIKSKDVDIADLAEKFNYKDASSLFAALGRGDLKLESLLRKVLPQDKPQLQDGSFITRFIEKARKSTKGVRVAGMDNIMLAFGKCCNPVPGDPITGIVSRGRGIVIHTNACKNLLRLMQDPDRIIDVTWDVEKGARFMAGVYILGERRNKFIAEITEAATAVDCNIISVSMNSEVSLMNCVLTVEVYDLDHLNRLMTKLRKMTGVITVGRLNE